MTSANSNQIDLAMRISSFKIKKNFKNRFYGFYNGTGVTMYIIYYSTRRKENCCIN